MRYRSHTVLASALGVALTGCAAAGPGVMAARSGAEPATELLVLPGHGTLLQDDITLTVQVDQLMVKVTPLEEWVLRLTAPDTWSRLSRLATTHRDEMVRQTGVARPALFLVSFFSRSPDAPFQPEDVQIVSRGRRHRPLAIRPLTTSWGTGRLGQEQTQQAVYAFAEDIDLDQPLTLDYGRDVGSGWDVVLRRLEVERVRARARAGLVPH